MRRQRAKKRAGRRSEGHRSASEIQTLLTTERPHPSDGSYPREHGENFIQIWNRLIPSVNCRTLISFFSVLFLFSVISGHPKGRSVVP